MTTELANQIAAQSPMLTRHAIKFTRDSFTAQDLVQDTILMALQHQDKFDGNNLKGWLYRILVNTFINQYRREVKMPQVDLSDMLYNSGILSNSTSNDAVSILFKQDITRVVCQLDRLLQPVALLRMEGYRYDEMAMVLNIPLGTVRNRLFRARAALPEREHF